MYSGWISTVRPVGGSLPPDTQQQQLSETISQLTHREAGAVKPEI